MKFIRMTSIGKHMMLFVP